MNKVKSIHTINARGNIFLEVMRDYLNLKPNQLLAEISGMRCDIENTLKRKGIKYEKLRSALVPSQDRMEIALVFDTMRIETPFYGDEIMKELIPLLEIKSNCSVLVGDYLPRHGQEEKLLKAFSESVDLRYPVEFHHPTQFFIVYINNLSKSMIERIIQGLLQYNGYVGMADTTYQSDFKILLSSMLAPTFVKHGKLIIQGHEPDRLPEENVNMCGYPFEDNGYVVKSVSDILYGVFLSYKIERPIVEGFEVDSDFSLNAISEITIDLDKLKIEVDERKLEYLKREKAVSIERAGLGMVSISGLADQIRGKIKQSYIYNLCSDSNHDVLKFNIVIELRLNRDLPPTRLLTALEYQPKKGTLRLITLY